MSESQAKLEKQAYLRSAILEEGYSDKGFMDCLESARKDGSDVDNWTLEELKMEVANYKRYVAPVGPAQASVDESTDSPQHKTDQPSEGGAHELDKSLVTVEEKKGSLETAEEKPIGKTEEKKESLGTKEESSETGKSSGVDRKSLGAEEENKESLAVVHEEKQGTEEKKKESLDTAEEKKEHLQHLRTKEEKKADMYKENEAKSKATKTVATMKPEVILRGLDARIIGVKLINPGYFSRNYLAYFIETPDEHWQVKRKEADFYDLKTILVKLYPAYAVPRLPKEPLKTTDPAQATTRRQALQRFLNQVLKHPALITCKFIREFLAETNDREYEKQKKQYANVASPRNVGECVTPEGVAVTSFDHSLSKYCLRLTALSAKLKEKFKALRSLNIKLAEQLAGVSATMEGIAAANSEISSVYGDASEVGMSGVFRTMEGLFANFAGVTKQLEARIRDHLANPIKDYKKEIGSIEDMLFQWRATKTRTVMMSARLKEKKELTFTTKDIKDWQLRPECKYSKQLLLTHKDIAFQEMLPADTAEVDKYKEIYGFFSNKVREEFRRVCAKTVSEFVDRQVAISHANISELDNMKKIFAAHVRQLDSVLKFEDPTVVCGGSGKADAAQAGVHCDSDDEL